MKTGVFYALILAFAIASAACASNRENGNGKIITKSISVNDYNSITIGKGIEHNEKAFRSNNSKRSPRFEYKQVKGNAFLEITIDENLLPLLDIQSSGSKLLIETKDGYHINPSELMIKGTSRDLNYLSSTSIMDFYIYDSFTTDQLQINISGAGDIKIKDRADIKSFKVDLSGAGDIEVKNLICDTFDGLIRGAGDLDLKGKAERATYYVSGAGDVNAYEFAVKDLACKVSGAGDLKVYATEYLDATVSGTGDIHYKGNPQTKTKVSGFGDIEKVK